MFKIGMKWLKRATEKKEDAIKIEDKEFAVYAYDTGRLPDFKGRFATLEMAKERANEMKKFFENAVILGVQTDKIIEML